MLIMATHYLRLPLTAAVKVAPAGTMSAATFLATAALVGAALVGAAAAMATSTRERKKA